MIGDAESLKAEITALLSTVNLASLRRIKAVIEKRKARPPRVSGCKPRDAPHMQWTPKHQVLTKKALQLVLDGFGMQTAPYAVGPDEWPHKLNSRPYNPVQGTES